jgi:inorganic phosphate transporter, PiT family
VDLAAIIVVIVVALGFDYTNGFHDAANAIATSVSTRALAPRTALIMAAVMNLVGAFLGTAVASTVGSGIIDAPAGIPGLVVVLCALIGAIVWNLVTWYFGMPSSSSHALIGGLVGAALASAGTVKWNGVVEKVIIPMVVSPVVGFVLAAWWRCSGSSGGVARRDCRAASATPRRSAPPRWRSATGCRTPRRRWA